ncbi:MAG: aldo/keto reductase [Ruminococcaceae bacterium]|nr:aldo/keto reductase [Oscillospiraceae bacterium]
MKKIRLGRTNLMVTRTSFGALPIQRVPEKEAIKILNHAYDGGINFYDTANMYTDSEEKIGKAFTPTMRSNIIISTKTGGSDYKTVKKHLENSLVKMNTDYIDILQLHNPAELPDPDNNDSSYRALIDAKKEGKIRFIGITNHKLHIANLALESGLYDTLQFPFNYLSTDAEFGLVQKSSDLDIGFIAMKALSGGLLKNSRACALFFRQNPTAVPIYGIQSIEELNEWLSLESQEIEMTPEIEHIIAADKRELSGNFCRSCGYCMPCAVGIEIKTAARMDMLLRRSPFRPLLSDENYNMMMKINDCINCGLCKTRCPYELDVPNLLKRMLKDYIEFYELNK